MQFTLNSSSPALNLCPHPDGGLFPALPPSVLPAPAGWHPVASLPDGRIVMASGSSIGILKGLAVPAPLSLDGEPRCVLTLGDDLIVATPTSLLRLVPSGDSLVPAPSAASSPLMPSVRAVDAGYVYASAAPVAISTSDTIGLISPARRNALAASVRAAYADLAASAAASGLLFEPTPAYCRVIDASGRELFATPPVLLVHPSARAFDGRFVFEPDPAYGFAMPAEVAAPAWRPELHVPDAFTAALPAGASVEMVLLPSLTPFRLSSAPFIVARRRSSDPLAVVTLKPASLPSQLAASSPVAPSLSAPVMVSAASAARSASLVAFGAPVFSRPAPPSPLVYAAEVDPSSGPWHAAVSVEFPDGAVRVSLAEGTSGAPVSFSPLLAYPAGGAVALSVTVRVASKVYSARFPLSASVLPGCSAYFSASSAPISLPAVDGPYVVPAARGDDVASPSAVALAPASDPLSALIVASVGDARVIAVHPAASSSPSWDFGRSRFYVFTSGGIYLLNADPSRAKASLSLLDPRVVRSPDAVVRVEGGVAALASSDLIVLSGSSVRTVLPAVPSAYVSLTWNHADHELWLVAPGSGVLVCCFDHSFGLYFMPLSLSSRVCNVAFDSSFVISDPAATVLRVGHGRAVESVDVGISLPIANYTLLYIEAPGNYSPMRVISSPHALASPPSFRLSADSTVDIPSRATVLTLSGTVSGPIALRSPFIRPSPRASGHLIITATASPSSRLLSLLPNKPNKPNHLPSRLT